MSFVRTPPKLIGLLSSEQTIAAATATALFAGAVYLLLSGIEERGEQLRKTVAAQPKPVSAPLPVAATSPAPATVAEPSIEGIVLQGVLGGGGGGSAILLLPSGQQRLVRTGRDILPGLMLKSVGVSHVIVERSSGDMRLDMGRAAATPVGPAPEKKSVAAPDANMARETLAYRLGLQQVKSDAGKGYVIKKGAELPQLQRAGLQVGDLILSVNGSVMNEERMTELAWTIANSEQTEFEYVRGGRRSKVAVK